MIKNIYQYLSKPENNGKRIGLLRIICSIFGGLFLAYLGMTLLAFILPGTVYETSIVSIMFNTFVWAVATTWIALSPTKLSALIRSIIPTIIFALAIFLIQ